MSDKKIVNIQLTKTKSVAAVEIGKNEYVDADGVTYKNIDSDLISDAEDISEEEKHTFKYLSSLYDGIAELEEKKHAIDAKIAASKKEIKKAEICREECLLLILLKRSETCFRKGCSMRWSIKNSGAARRFLVRELMKMSYIS